jgi:hypothetical protein
MKKFLYKLLVGGLLEKNALAQPSYCSQYPHSLSELEKLGELLGASIGLDKERGILDVESHLRWIGFAMCLSISGKGFVSSWL